MSTSSKSSADQTTTNENLNLYAEEGGSVINIRDNANLYQSVSETELALFERVLDAAKEAGGVAVQAYEGAINTSKQALSDSAKIIDKESGNDFQKMASASLPFVITAAVAWAAVKVAK